MPDQAKPPPEDVPEGDPPDVLSETGVVPPPTRPAPEPLDVDVARLVLIGMGVWAVAFFVLLPFRSRLEASGDGFWLWTCAAGFGLGILGYLLSSRAQRR